MTHDPEFVAGPFHTRRKARRVERMLQSFLDAGEKAPNVPDWADGVKVVRIGGLLPQYVIVATERTGH